MRDSMKYVNHIGEVFEFGTANVLINQNDFRNYEWIYNSQYDRITSFEKKMKTKKLHVIIVSDESRKIANRLLEIIEKDVLSNTPGQMYIGEYYLKGYFYGSEKTSYTHERVVELDLSFVSDQGYWVKEYPYVFRVNDEGSGGDEFGLGYSYDYPYGFSSPIASQNMFNTSFTPANIIINIYGAVINPKITIGGNVYQILTTVKNNEIITINSKEKTAILTNQSGEKTSVFALRNLEHYLFAKVKPGNIRVTVEPEFNVGLTLLEERSEPLWI